MHTRRKGRNTSTSSPSNQVEESDDEQLTIADSNVTQDEEAIETKSGLSNENRRSLRKKKPNPALDALVEESDEEDDDNGLQMIDDEEEQNNSEQASSTTTTSGRPQRAGVKQRNFAEELGGESDEGSAKKTSGRRSAKKPKGKKTDKEPQEWEQDGVNALLNFAFLATGEEDEDGKGKTQSPRAGSPSKDDKKSKKRGRPPAGGATKPVSNRRKLNQPDNTQAAIESALNGPVGQKPPRKQKKASKTNFGSPAVNHRISARFFTTQTLDNDFLSSRRLVPPPFGTKQLDTAFLASIKELDLNDLSRGSRHVTIPPLSTDPVVTMSATRAMTSNRRPNPVPPSGGASHYERCATHVAIAYYIYYQSNQKRDPTTNAKQLKTTVQAPPAPQRGRTNGTTAPLSSVRTSVPPPSNTPGTQFYKYPNTLTGTASPRPQQTPPQQGKGAPPVNGSFQQGYVQPPMSLPARPPSGIAPTTYNPPGSVTPPNRGVAQNIMPGANFQGLAPTTLQAPGRGTFPTGYPYGQPYATNQQFVQMRPNATPPQPQKRPHLPTGTTQTTPPPQQQQQQTQQQRPPQQPTNPLSSLGVVNLAPQQPQQHARPTANISNAVAMAPKTVQPGQTLTQQQVYKPSQAPLSSLQIVPDVKQETTK